MTPLRPVRFSGGQTSAVVVTAGVTAEHGRPRLGALRRGTLFGLGTVSLVLGVFGIFLPLLPTTCFLLLSAWCFARSSPGMYRWLHHNALFGRYLRDYRDHKVISRRVRSGSLTVLWGTLIVSMVVLSAHAWAIVLLLAVGTSVSWHLFSLSALSG